MKKLNRLNKVIACFVLICCSFLPAHSQMLKDTSTNWTAWMEKGKRQKTTGLFLLGLGAASFAICALSEPERKSTGWGHNINAAQAGAFLAGLLFTTSGLITFLSGDSKVRRSKWELGKTTYYLLPGHQINGPSVSLKISLGK